MGRIKTKLVKRTAKELIERDRNIFSKDFNLNKQVLKDVAEINSKKLKNVIAGYIARLMRKE
mgnify:FL=1